MFAYYMHAYTRTHTHTVGWGYKSKRVITDAQNQKVSKHKWNLNQPQKKKKNHPNHKDTRLPLSLQPMKACAGLSGLPQVSLTCPSLGSMKMKLIHSVHICTNYYRTGCDEGVTDCQSGSLCFTIQWNDPDERPDWWETTPHDPDERPPWQKTRLMRDNTPYKAICFCSFFFVKTFPSRLHAKETRYKAPLKTLLLDF